MIICVHSIYNNRMQCALNRFGPGTSCYRPTTTATKEIQDKLKAMQLERGKQDKMWEEEPPKPLVKKTQSK